MKPKRAGRGIGFDKAYFDLVAHPVAFTGSFSHKSMGIFNMLIVVAAKRRDRYKAVGSRIGEFYEQPEARNARNPC